MPKYIIPITVILSLIVGAVLFYFVYNTYTNAALPPGCQKHIFPTFGGCFAQYAIKDIEVTPGNDCIQVSPNNCNSPLLSVRNTCKEDIVVNNITVPPTVTRCSRPLQTFYITADSDNNAVIQSSRACTEAQQDMQLSGQINSKAVTITVRPSDHPLYYFPPEYESCLRVRTIGGDCRHTILEYSCDAPLQIEGSTINPKEETCETRPGEADIIQHDNAPPEDTKHTIDGQRGNNFFSLTYTLTKKQCE